MITHDNEHYYVESNGIVHYHPESYEPEKDFDNKDSEEIAVCIKWITDYCEELKHINKKVSSYNLKHLVERESGIYISNGSFIQAAINVGLKILPDIPNAFFNLKIKQLQVGDEKMMCVECGERMYATYETVDGEKKVSQWVCECCGNWKFGDDK